MPSEGDDSAGGSSGSTKHELYETPTHQCDSCRRLFPSYEAVVHHLRHHLSMCKPIGPNGGTGYVIIAAAGGLGSSGGTKHERYKWGEPSSEQDATPTGAPPKRGLRASGGDDSAHQGDLIPSSEQNATPTGAQTQQFKFLSKRYTGFGRFSSNDYVIAAFAQQQAEARKSPEYLSFIAAKTQDYVSSGIKQWSPKRKRSVSPERAEE